MKAILEFDLGDFDDKEKHNLCVKSLEMYTAFQDLSKELRRVRRYEDEYPSKQGHYKEFEDFFHETVAGLGLEI